LYRYASASVIAQTDAAMDTEAGYAGEPLLLNDTTPAFSPHALWRLGDALAGQGVTLKAGLDTTCHHVIIVRQNTFNILLMTTSNQI
jgi:hypothetical protein